MFLVLSLTTCCSEGVFFASRPVRSLWVDMLSTAAGRPVSRPFAVCQSLSTEIGTFPQAEGSWKPVVVSETLATCVFDGCSMRFAESLSTRVERLVDSWETTCSKPSRSEVSIDTRGFGLCLLAAVFPLAPQGVPVDECVDELPRGVWG